LNSTCEKAVGKSLAARDHHALELFAPKLIHESRTCSIVHMLPQISPEKKHYRWSTDRRSHYDPAAAFLLRAIKRFVGRLHEFCV
jgi:hypothetical protein